MSVIKCALIQCVIQFAVTLVQCSTSQLVISPYIKNSPTFGRQFTLEQYKKINLLVRDLPTAKPTNPVKLVKQQSNAATNRHVVHDNPRLIEVQVKTTVTPLKAVTPFNPVINPVINPTVIPTVAENIHQAVNEIIKLDQANNRNLYYSTVDPNYAEFRDHSHHDLQQSLEHLKQFERSPVNHNQRDKGYEVIDGKLYQVVEVADPVQNDHKPEPNYNSFQPEVDPNYHEFEAQQSADQPLLHTTEQPITVSNRPNQLIADTTIDPDTNPFLRPGSGFGGYSIKNLVDKISANYARLKSQSKHLTQQFTNQLRQPFPESNVMVNEVVVPSQYANPVVAIPITASSLALPSVNRPSYNQLIAPSLITPTPILLRPAFSPTTPPTIESQIENSNSDHYEIIQPSQFHDDVTQDPKSLNPEQPEHPDTPEANRDHDHEDGYSTHEPEHGPRPKLVTSMIPGKLMPSKDVVSEVPLKHMLDIQKEYDNYQKDKKLSLYKQMMSDHDNQMKGAKFCTKVCFVNPAYYDYHYRDRVLAGTSNLITSLLQRLLSVSGYKEFKSALNPTQSKQKSVIAFPVFIRN